MINLGPLFLVSDKSNLGILTGTAQSEEVRLCNKYWRARGFSHDPNTNTWTPISTSGAMTPLYQGAGIWTGEEMIVWGGCMFKIYEYVGISSHHVPFSNTLDTHPSSMLDSLISV